MTGRLLLLLLTLLMDHPARVRLHGTSRLPKASAEAKVERNLGSTKIGIELDEMKPASLFGGDFTTYVLWIVSLDDQVQNAGEFILDGNRSKLAASTGLREFGMFITAEPHYLVDVPSTFQVLGSEAPIAYHGSRRVYNYERDSLAEAREAKGLVQNAVKQAFIAVQLAQRAGAHDLARDELIRAKKSLQATFTLSENGSDRTEVNSHARETIRLAFAAQRLAEDRRRTNSTQ